MSMTREEATYWLENGWNHALEGEYREAFDLAVAALCGPTREQVEEVWRGCYTCDEYKYFMFNAWTNPESSERPDCMGTSLFCPHCGKPLTDEAVQMVMERMEALKDEL